jgi:hypothetical protein
MTKWSEPSSLHAETSSSGTTTSSQILKCTTSIISDLATIKLRSIALESHRSSHDAKKKLATDTTMATALDAVDVYMPATSVETLHTLK